MFRYILVVIMACSSVSYSYTAESVTETIESSDIIHLFINETKDIPQQDEDTQLCNEIASQHVTKEEQSFFKKQFTSIVAYTFIQLITLKQYTTHMSGVVWKRMCKATSVLCGFDD